MQTDTTKKFNPKKPILFEIELAKLIHEHLPKMSEEWKIKCSNAWPWVTLIFAVLLFPAVLLVFTIGLFAGGLSFSVGNLWGSISMLLSSLLLLVSFIASCISIPLLFKRKRLGWVIVYFSTLINIILNVMDFSFFSLLFSLFSLYIIFQIREYYGSEKDYVKEPVIPEVESV